MKYLVDAVWKCCFAFHKTIKLEFRFHIEFHDKKLINFGHFY